MTPLPATIELFEHCYFSGRVWRTWAFNEKVAQLMDLIEEFLLFLSTTFRIIVLWQGLLRAATLMNCGLDG